jgi:hypothetical protein
MVFFETHALRVLRKIEISVICLFTIPYHFLPNHHRLSRSLSAAGENKNRSYSLVYCTFRE